MENIFALDYEIISYIAQNLHSDLLTSIMRLFTFLGDHGLIWLIIGIPLLVHPKTRRWGAAFLFALAFTALVSEYGIKFLIQRDRPFLQYAELLPLVSPPSGYSFPSSHAATGFACAAVLFQMKRPAGLAAAAVAACIAFSRVYLCLHFPSDILAGALLGICLGTLITIVARRVADRIHYSKLR